MNYGSDISDNNYVQLAKKTMGVPELSGRKKMEYYTLSYYRAAKKRIASVVTGIF